MLSDSGDPPVLLLIDIQQGIDNPAKGPRNNPNAEKTTQRLLSTWRDFALPIVHVRHNSTDPTSKLQKGTPGFDYKEGLSPRDKETEFVKRVHGAFTGTELSSWLFDQGVETLVICGMVTDHCVSTTAREAGDRGFEVFVVEDATATFGRRLSDMEFDAETIHQTALAQLNGEFAEIVEAEEILNAVTSVR